MIRRATALLLSLWIGACGGTMAPAPTCHSDGSCAVDESCTLSTDCVTGICDEVCRLPCADEDQCPVAQGCRVLALPDGPVSACVPTPQVLGDLGDPCDADDVCRGGICRDGRCTELCTSCPAGARCVPQMRGGLDLGVCEWAPAAPTLSLGPFVANLDGTSAVDITVPVGLESLTIIVRDANPGGTRRVGIASLVSPSGVVLEDGDLAGDDPNPAAIRYPDASAVLVPIRDDIDGVEPGVYRVAGRIWDIDFNAPDPFVPTEGELFFDVIYEWAGERGGLLDLNVFTTGVDEAFLTAVLDVVQTQFAGAGILLGDIVGASLPAPYEAIDDSEAVRALCRGHAQPGTWGTAVNVFLVNELDFALGFTGGSPSPPGIIGLAPSGTVIATGSDPSQTGIVVAHELGHFLGLSHTTAFNADGSVFGTDPISDTPECEAAAADCPDRANLMFPVIDFAQPHALSEGQLRVLGRNPALHEFVRRDLCPGLGVRDLTLARRAAGLLAADAPACAGAGVAHLLRVTAPATLSLTAGGAATGVSVQGGPCGGGEELACAGVSWTGTLEPGEYFVVVDGEPGAAYSLEVAEAAGGP